MYQAILFVFGLIFGSFLNVVSLRYDPEKNVFDFKKLSGRSYCPHCKVILKWYDLFPLFSFLFLRGRCRNCGGKISIQYPLVELASGLIFLLPFYLYSPGMDFNYFVILSGIWMVIFEILLLVWTIDYRLYLIPDELNILIAFLGIGLTYFTDYYGKFGFFDGSFVSGYAGLFGLRGNIWVNHLGAAFFALIFVGGIILLSRGRGMGMGDLKLLAALGLVFGWPDILFVFIFGTMIGAAFSLILIALKKTTLKSAVPFGPFLVLGAASLFFFGEYILWSYFNLVGF